MNELPKIEDWRYNNLFQIDDDACWWAETETQRSEEMEHQDFYFTRIVIRDYCKQ